MEDQLEDSIVRSYPYAHYSLGSKPKITSDIIDEQIAKLMDLLNEYPSSDINQLKVIEKKIKDKIKEKEDNYLISTNEPIRNTTKRVGFIEGTKLGGKKRKNRKTRKNRRHRKH